MQRSSLRLFLVLLVGEGGLDGDVGGVRRGDWLVLNLLGLLLAGDQAEGDEMLHFIKMLCSGCLSLGTL